MNTKPEDLPEKDLKKAKGIADVFTNIRKFLYLFFSIGSAIALFGVAAIVGTNSIIQLILLILTVPYILFKVRDFVRGTI